MEETKFIPILEKEVPTALNFYEYVRDHVS